MGRLIFIIKKQIYVNRGVGHLGYAGRVGIMPDISVLKLKMAQLKFNLSKVNANWKKTKLFCFI